MAKKVTVDFSNENSVKQAMAKELSIKPSDLEISKHKYLQNAYLLEVGNKEYVVVENEDVAYEMAIESVTRDIEEDPTMFESNFLRSFVDTDKLRKELFNDAYNINYETLKEDAEQSAIKFMKRYNLEIPEHDDYQELEVKDSDIEDLAEEQTNKELKNPLQYLEDLSNEKEALAKAIEIAGVDIEHMAEEAVGVDGPGHFLSSYDGNTYNGPGGLVYWRVN